MDKIFLALLAAAIKEPEIRSFLEEMTIKVIAEVFHRRSLDPEYLAASDSAFRQWGNAASVEEKDAALKNLLGLLNRPAT